MPTDEDEISQHYESAWIGLDELAHDIGEVKYQLAVYGDRRNKQVSELQDLLDTVLDVCPPDKITLLLLRDEPGLTKQIARWQPKKRGVTSTDDRSGRGERSRSGRSDDQLVAGPVSIRMSPPRKAGLFRSAESKRKVMSRMSPMSSLIGSSPVVPVQMANRYSRW